MKSLKTRREKTLYKGFRLIATIVLLAFIFFEELVLKPLRKIKIAILERTIKRWNGYWTVGILVVLKTIEGLLKIVMLVFPLPIVIGVAVVLDGVLGFISMNIIIHGRENLKDFAWYVRFTAWVDKLTVDVKALPVYQRTHTKAIELKDWAKKQWGKISRKIFGERNPRGILRYIRTAVYLKLKKIQS